MFAQKFIGNLLRTGTYLSKNTKTIFSRSGATIFSRNHSDKAPDHMPKFEILPKSHEEKSLNVIPSRFYTPEAIVSMSSQTFVPRPPEEREPVKVFLRRPLTQTDAEEAKKIQEFINWLKTFNIELLLADSAKSGDTFKADFTKDTGIPFNPLNFRRYRLQKLIKEADCVIFYWGKGLSVSGGFEIGYLQAVRKYGFVDSLDEAPPNTPILFALAEKMLTTLMQDLKGSTYISIHDLMKSPKPMLKFLDVVDVEKQARDAGNRLAKSLNSR